MHFKPPKSAERLRAISSTKGLTETLRLVLDPGSDFEPIPAPKPGDWLAEHPEPGQTFDHFVGSNPNKLDIVRNKVYLQPLDAFSEAQSPSVETLRTYAAAFFLMDVTALPPLTIGEAEFRTRVNPFTQNRQILTTDILRFLKTTLPKDAFCLLAITMEDLYPHHSWNFVFGQASLYDHVGVFSFARYDPAFYGEARGNDYHQVLLRRSCKVLAHEIAHMFSLQHCIFFKCGMNGSNHLRESDSRPLHICPVCLRKLQYCIGFDVVIRYEKLHHFYQKVDFGHEATWVAKRLKKITGSK
ncbi:MAG: hypothetical protein KAV83_07630 [Desulfobacterales bacterium]|nr:hypothetical protein [Desulfobacterales bacterium]